MSFLTILTIVEGKAPIFRTDAVFFTEAGFKKMIRGAADGCQPIPLLVGNTEPEGGRGGSGYYLPGI